MNASHQRKERFSLFAWVAVAIFGSVFLLQRDLADWVTQYPEAWTLPAAAWANIGMDWFVDHFRWLFRAISWLLTWPMDAILGLLTWLPWPTTISLFIGIAFVAGGWPLALFTLFALLYMVGIGYWTESMRTLALVAVSVPLSVLVGFGLGVSAWRSERANRLVQPLLDLMQTVPTFAYLIPILLLFGFGPVVGMIASAIYACPPMVRSTVLGLQRVPEETVESGIMSGASSGQLFWWVRFPSALPTILVGVNQSTMAALSMVIIAAIIGSSADIGWEVLSTMRRANFGESLLAGIVVALIAMLLDRITRGFAQDNQRSQTTRALRPRLILGIAGTAALSFLLLSLSVTELSEFPDPWVFYPAAQINDAILFITVEFGAALDQIKNGFLFFFLLPLRIGLENTIRPFTWGFDLTLTMKIGYLIACASLMLLSGYRYGWRFSVAIGIAAVLLYFGIERMPWPAMIALLVTLAWQTGGARVGLFTLAGLAFMLVTGVWSLGVRSLYLCFAAVLVSFIIGGSLGVWASQSDRVSRLVRPINDTLQTMPLFVLLIPILMFFQVGEFTAFLAIIAYAIVPAIRYTEHGLRHVNNDVVEAAIASGCTPFQILWQVRLPLAIPEIMLGLNQTIMFGLAMLIIAALVGTQGLGQAVYVALGQADFGEGLVAGLGIAFIAMSADRIIQAVSAEKKRALGIK